VIAYVTRNAWPTVRGRFGGSSPGGHSSAGGSSHDGSSIVGNSGSAGRLGAAGSASWAARAAESGASASSATQNASASADRHPSEPERQRGAIPVPVPTPRSSAGRHSSGPAPQRMRTISRVAGVRFRVPTPATESGRSLSHVKHETGASLHDMFQPSIPRARPDGRRPSVHRFSQLLAVRRPGVRAGAGTARETAEQPVPGPRQPWRERYRIGR